MKSIGYLVTVYNEYKTVKQSIKDVIDINYLNKKILVIDNASTDGSRQIIESFKQEDVQMILRSKNEGFGRTIQEGINLLDTDYIYIQYSDLEYDHLQSLKMMNYAIENNLDVVLGSRLVTENMKKLSKIKILLKKPSFLATIICTFMTNKFYDNDFSDIIGGKLYKTETIKKIPISCFNQGFDFQFISRIFKKKLKVGEIFIKYKPRENSSDKKIKFYHMINALYEIIKVKFFE